MGAVESVPEDALDKVGCWLQKDDLLRLRETAPHGREAARRAIALTIPHVRAYTVEEQGRTSSSAGMMRARPQAVEAMGRVFGAGCVKLVAIGGNTVSAHAALSSFVSSTNGGLRELYLAWTNVSSDLLVAMCRTSPNLVALAGSRFVQISDQAIVAIAGACPKLEKVRFSDVGTELSPAERWQQHFPRLRCLTLRNGAAGFNHDTGWDNDPYRPTQLENISVAARSNCATDLDLEGCHIFPDLIEAIVGTPVGDRLTRISSRDINMPTTNIEPDALLAAARGFPCLTRLWIPYETRLPTGWFAQLAQIRPFEKVYISSRHATDSQVVEACSQNPVKTLELCGIADLTRAAIDGIISSQSAATLQKLTITFCELHYDHIDDEVSYRRDIVIRAADLVRLARACRSLSTLIWEYPYRNPATSAQRTAQAEITALLGLRGGEFKSFVGYD